MRRLLVTLCALLVTSLTPIANAQTEAPNASEIASAVQRFYGALGTLELGFTQTYWSGAYGRTLRTSAGTLRIRRPGRLRFDSGDGRGRRSGHALRAGRRG